MVQIDLAPSGTSLQVETGSRLRGILGPYEVEFACDGTSLCGSCRVQVLEGSLPVTEQDAEIFRPEELAAGWRLACQAVANHSLRLRCSQGAVSILSDSKHCTPTERNGLGIAIDVGTTTIVAQLIDLSTGKLVGERSALNPQAKFGADVMTRVRCALHDNELTQVIKECLGAMIADLAGAHRNEIVEVVLVGNTVMHHLFSGIDVKPLSHVPFTSGELGEQHFCSGELGWSTAPDCNVRFLPCIGGFVGSDILAGITAVGQHQSSSLSALIDLGTNGEIAIGNRDRIVCASTAAGTAFEAGSIKMGMRASTGAISRVLNHKGKLRCKVIGGGDPQGICGSGLVDAVAVALELGVLHPSGRLNDGRNFFHLAGTVNLYQADIRELQLAKAAIAAGIRLLLVHLGVTMDCLDHVYLAGAFGNYVSPSSAARIGLLEMPIERVFPVGNAALRGAKMELTSGGLPDLSKIEHYNLASDLDFQETFIACMTFSAKQMQETLSR
jgi:uncharacterized 2Fe-2S/4Fe-4S cluster protein (DUF4445 family)